MILTQSTVINSDDKSTGLLLQKVIQKATGVTLAISTRTTDALIIKREFDTEDRILVNKNEIFYGGDMATFAVGRFCERYFGAMWLWATDSGLFTDSRTLPIKLSARITYEKKNIFRVVRNVGGHRQWLNWHGIDADFDETDFHKSWFLGMALKYPQLAPTTGKVTEHTKINLLHDDLPAILYQDWIDRGRPDTYSLFEVDGNGYWWQAEQYDFTGLNDGNRDWAKKVLGQGLEPDWSHPSIANSPNTPEMRAWWNDNVIVHQAHPLGKRRVSHLHLYIEAYKKIEEYFISQGANIRFRILGYAAYYFWNENPDVDLSNFDLYLCPPETQRWDSKTRNVATQNMRRWARTGCRIIFRPNLFDQNYLPIHRHDQLSPFLIQLRKLNGGLFLTQNYVPGTAPLDWYIRIRTHYSGKNRQKLAEEFYKFVPEARDWVQVALTRDFENLPVTGNAFLDEIKNLSTTVNVATWEASLRRFPQLSNGVVEIKQALKNTVPEEA